MAKKEKQTPMPGLQRDDALFDPVVMKIVAPMEKPLKFWNVSQTDRPIITPITIHWKSPLPLTSVAAVCRCTK